MIRQKRGEIVRDQNGKIERKRGNIMGLEWSGRKEDGKY